MKKLTSVPMTIPETLTAKALWSHILANHIKPRPLRYAIERAFDDIMAVPGTRSIEDIVTSLVQGEARFKRGNSKSFGPVSLDVVYDGLTERKMGLSQAIIFRLGLSMVRSQTFITFSGSL